MHSYQSLVYANDAMRVICNDLQKNNTGEGIVVADDGLQVSDSSEVPMDDYTDSYYGDSMMNPQDMFN